MYGITLQKIIDSQAELNQIIIQYLKSVKDDRLRQILAGIAAQGHRNVQELSGYPAGPRCG